MNKFTERFWSKVEKSGDCWEWTGDVVATGYGRIFTGADVAPALGMAVRTNAAHRVAWAITRGPIPDGLCVCHHCDNPPCVRPDHLFLGTNAENIKDAARKGRMRRKLSDVEVSQIRLLAERGIPQVSIARLYNIADSTVSRIASGKGRFLRVLDIGDAGLPPASPPPTVVRAVPRLRLPPRLAI